MATAIDVKYLTPEQVCEIVPGMTKNNLGLLRFRGRGPKYLKPTPRVVVYRESDVFAWLEGSERTGTAENAR
ncbi:MULTISPECIES: helix-turn-helix transcriptional regulator [unclassified Microbacterium]|uniref:helix-turn-helix transcriptional regulator n=1 Tax=unclassified Microbacterium TaxID=2609290 RepID=UPI0036581B52